MRACAAGRSPRPPVNVQIVRYYERRGLLVVIRTSSSTDTQ
ncbi:hypothetical protein AB0D27_37620 [Streptomyces sp. NPDC048415]